MAAFVPNPDLDPKVAQAIADAMDALRGELLGHLAPRKSPPEPAAPPPQEPAAAAISAPPAAPAGGDRMARLETAVEALDHAGSQTELLTSLLQEAGAFADRALFLVRDGEQLRGWAAFGFVGSEADVDRVAVEGPRKALDGLPVDDPAAGERIAEQMLAPAAVESVMVPFVLRGKAAGALYADRLSQKSAVLDRAALRLLGYIAAQALETLPLRHGSAAAEAAPETRDVEAELDRMIEEVVPGAPIDEPDEVDLEARIQEVAPEAALEDGDQDIVAIRQEVSPAFGREESTTEDLAAGAVDTALEEEDLRLEVETQEVSTVESEVRPAPRPSVDVGREVEDAEVAPPDDLEGPGWAFSSSSTISDDNRHEEARRLARLLVTEIKLYNEEKVRQGRENHDVYEKLREDIERSRRIYAERIDDEIRAEADYFQEEVVRILAGGDSAALGA